MYYLVVDNKNKSIESFAYFSDCLDFTQKLIDDKNFDYFLIEELEEEDYQSILYLLIGSEESSYNRYYFRENFDEKEDEHD